jgi:hypothetical protein
VQGQRKEGEYSREDCDEHRSQAENSGVDNRVFEVVTFVVAFFDVVEKDYGVADNNAHQAGNSEKSHESEGLMHDPQSAEGANHPIGSGG